MDGLSIDPEGNLILQTAHGALTQQKPVIYQEVDGRRHQIDGRYELRADDRVGFHVSSYDPSRPLVIDPVLSYSTYLGGNGNDVGHAIAVDSTGNAYVTGVNPAPRTFPAPAAGRSSRRCVAADDLFVTKLNVTGTALVYSTYLGGSGNEIGRAIAIDGTGNVYVTGETNSPTQAGAGNVPFPIVGPIQPIYGSNGDAFVTKLNATGNAIVYSTYLGGGGVDRGYGIAVDGAGNAYVTGHTNSLNFPIAAAFQAATRVPGQLRRVRRQDQRRRQRAGLQHVSGRQRQRVQHLWRRDCRRQRRPGVCRGHDGLVEFPRRRHEHDPGRRRRRNE